MTLMKQKQASGLDSQEAIFEVLDTEVVEDFEKEFTSLGLSPELAHKQAETRLWMLEHLANNGCTPEAACLKVVALEKELLATVRGKDPNVRRLSST
jgi:hypothetical protein